MSNYKKIYVIFQDGEDESGEDSIITITKNPDKAQRVVDYFSQHLYRVVYFVEYDLETCEGLCDTILSGVYREYSVRISRKGEAKIATPVTKSNFYIEPNKVSKFSEYYSGHIWAKNEAEAIKQFMRLIEKEDSNA